jgi:hypothetical protein
MLCLLCALCEHSSLPVHHMSLALGAPRSLLTARAHTSCLLLLTSWSKRLMYICQIILVQVYPVCASTATEVFPHIVV